MATREAQQLITVDPIHKSVIQCRINGLAPLVVHSWGSKARDMLNPEKKLKGKERPPRDPEGAFLESLYWISDRPTSATIDDVKGATFGFPSVALKNAMVSACRYVENVTMTFAKGAWYVNPDQLLTAIDAPAPTMLENVVRIARGTADLRWRACFWPWSMDLDIVFNDNAISGQSVINLLNLSGFHVGIGEGRPASPKSAGMGWGIYEVQT